MAMIIFTELTEEQSDSVKDFFKKNPKRKTCNLEVSGRKYEIKKEVALKSKTIKLMSG